MKAAGILAAGLLFGAGLVVSGMADPAKVLAFLDLRGAWDPTLAIVMAAALAVAWPGTRWALARRPGLRRAPGPIDARLVSGAATFGLGWGLSGVCPGPALAGLVLGQGGALLFVLAMAAGMLGARAALGPRQSAP